MSVLALFAARRPVPGVYLALVLTLGIGWLVVTMRGGALFNQAAHQVDIVRLLAGGKVTSVHATVGDWDPARPMPGHCGRGRTLPRCRPG